MLPDVDTLPDAEGEATVGNRDLFRGAGEGSADVGGHIIRAFRAVDVVVAFGHQFCQEVAEVAKHVGVGVFLNHQASGGMAQK